MADSLKTERAILGGQTAGLPGYINCRCGRHWWNLLDSRWVTLHWRGEREIEGEVPGCCRVEGA